MFFFALIVLSTQILWAVGPTATAPSGSGSSSADPYLITSLGNLYWIVQQVNSGTSFTGKFFKQTTSIDASATSGGGVWGTQGWIPIGNATTKFSGTYDGNNQTISGIYINGSTSTYQGLFGYINGATIKDLGVINVSISAEENIGALAGGAYGPSTISNCYSTGTITVAANYDRGGGLVGAISGTTLTNCYSACNVAGGAGSSVLGGFVGTTGDGETCTITNCYASGNVNGSDVLGGFVGETQGGTAVTNCYSTGTVTGDCTFGFVAGFVGWIETYATIDKCYSTGNVNASGPDGSACIDIAGFAGAINDLGSGISNSYCTGNVTTTGDVSNVAGFIADIYEAASTVTIAYCYSTGVLSVAKTGATVGGFICSTDPGTTFTANFWDAETDGLTGTSSGSTNIGAVGRSTAEMTTDTTFINAGWSSSVWNRDAGINNGYPYLKWQNPSGTPLPVELSSFKATAASSSATLSWKTATETNNYGFEVERRLVGKTINGKWEKLGFVAGNGTSNVEHTYSYSDASISSGTYAYRLKQIDNSGTFKYSSEAQITIAVPAVFALGQNYPNPFNPTTTIKYDIPVGTYGNTSIKVYDVVGREVATLVNETKEAGSYQVTFNASKLASGVYFYKLQAGSYSSVKKLVLMK
jgi:hypothetical protein